MPVDVTDKGLRPRVRDLHRPTGLQREHAGVGLHGQVLPSAECSSDARHGQPNFFDGKPQHDRELLLVYVKPLGRDVQVDATLAVRNRQARLRPEGRLVLHADLILAPHHDVRAWRGLTVADLHPARDIAVGMQLRRVR